MENKNLTEKTREFWNRTFSKSSYDYKSLSKANWTPFVNKLKKFNVQTILDLGCGYGHWSIVLAKAGFCVTAVDISCVAINILRNWAKTENVKIKTIIYPAQQLKLNSKFDFIVCNSVLDHIPVSEAMKSVKNIKRHLKKNGIAYVSFDGPDNSHKKDYLILRDGTRVYTKGKFKNMLWRFYTDQEIRSLLQNFKILSFETRRNGKRDIWVRNN